MDTKALRQKILDLAIRGKLVPQNPNDEPASILLEKIREQKQQMFKEGKLKKKDIKNDSIIFKGEDNLHYEKFQDGTVKCIEDEIPFEVPEGWNWARLRDICMMSAGKSKSTDQIKSEPFEGSYPCFGGNGVRGYVDEYNQDGIFSIVGRQGALCGNINIAIGKFYATEHAVVTTLFDGIDFKWSNYILEALRLNNYATGAAQPGLSVANILNVFVPVPPTQEQDRIGNNVYESLKIVEALEQEKIDLQKIIIAAKTKILDLAIRGKLVPQDPNDEPASVLLERIRAEKEELIKQGKIKRDKKESVIFKGDDNSYYEKIGNKLNCIDEQLPFKLPDGWSYERLGNICSIARGGSPRPIENYLTDAEDGLNWIKIGDTEQGGKYIYSTKEKIRPEGVSKTRYVHCGDFLLTNSMSFGRPYILKTDGCIHDGWLVIGDVEAVFIQDYLYYMLSSSIMYDLLSRLAAGSTVKNLKSDSVKSLIVPIPPRKEQDKISKHIENVFSIISLIEESLN